MSAKTRVYQAGSVHTTGPQSVALVAKLLEGYCAVTIQASGNGRAVGGGSMHFQLFAGVEAADGVLTLVGKKELSRVASQAMNAAAVDLVIQGQYLLLTVSGVAGKEIDWFGEIFVQVN